MTMSVASINPPMIDSVLCIMPAGDFSTSMDFSSVLKLKYNWHLISKNWLFELWTPKYWSRNKNISADEGARQDHWKGKAICWRKGVNPLDQSESIYTFRHFVWGLVRCLILFQTSLLDRLKGNFILHKPYLPSLGARLWKITET